MLGCLRLALRVRGGCIQRVETGVRICSDVNGDPGLDHLLRTLRGRFDLWPPSE